MFEEQQFYRMYKIFWIFLNFKCKIMKNKSEFVVKFHCVRFCRNKRMNSKMSAMCICVYSVQCVYKVYTSMNEWGACSITKQTVKRSFEHIRTNAFTYVHHVNTMFQPYVNRVLNITQIFALLTSFVVYGWQSINYTILNVET